MVQPLVNVLGRNTSGDGGGGAYVLQSGSVTNPAKGVLRAGLGRVWKPFQSPPDSLGGILYAPITRMPSNTTVYAFGDSQTSGANGATTNYTSGGGILERYKWVTIIATNRGWSYNNYGIGGTSHAYFTNSSPIGPGVKSPFNQFGRNMENTWTGLATHMVGYNTILRQDRTLKFDFWIQQAVEAFVARALLTGYATGVTGQDRDGTTLSGWTTTGSNEDEAFPEATPFPYGAPGTDNRRRLVLDSGETISATFNGKSDLFVFLESAVTGGNVQVSSNGVPIANVDTAYAADLGAAYPGVVRLCPGGGSITLTITNSIAPSTILGVGWIDSSAEQTVANRCIIIGSCVPRVVFNVSSKVTADALTRRVNLATEMALSNWADFNVFYADVFAVWDKATGFDAQDQDHFTPHGNQLVAQAFENAYPPTVSFGQMRMAANFGPAYSVPREGGRVFNIDRIWGIRLNLGIENTASDVVQEALEGNNAQYTFARGTNETAWRWSLRLVGDAEDGISTNAANTGSSFGLLRRSDAGAAAGYAWFFNRHDASGYFTADITNRGNLTVGQFSDTSTRTVAIDAATNITKYLKFRSGGLDRFGFEVGGDTTNAHSSLFRMLGYANDGSLRLSLFTINRVDGSWGFSGSGTNNGNLTVGTSAGAGARAFVLEGPTNIIRSMVVNGSGVKRWEWQELGDSSSVANQSLLRLLAYSNAGATIGTALAFNRFNQSWQLFGDGTNNGHLTVGAASSAVNRTLSISAASNNLKRVEFQSDGVARWSVGTATNETGLNNGSDFIVQSKTDLGVTLSAPLVIARSNGLVTLATGLRVGDGASLSAWYTGSTTWDPASVPAGVSTTNTVTVTGATVGNPAMAGLTTLTTEGLQLSATVSGAGFVRVVLFNPTSAAVDLASGTLNVAVLKFF